MPRPGPSLCGVLMAVGSNVCANFQEFLTMLSPPKTAWIVDKKKIKNKKNPNENNRALRLSGLGPNNKRSRFKRVLCTIGARSLIIIIIINGADSIGSSAPSVLGP